MNSSDDLYPLPVGTEVKIGRKPSCEVVIRSPHISNVHCIVNSTLEITTKEAAVVKTSVLDCSRNGTWIGTCRHSGVPGSAEATRLSKETPSQLDIGDVIYLLAPGHRDSANFRLELTSAGEAHSLLHHGRNLGSKSQSVKRKSDGHLLETSEAKFPRVHSAGSHSRSVVLSGLEVSPSSPKVNKEPHFVSDGFAEEKGEEEENGCCPNCSALIPVTILPDHYSKCLEYMCNKEKLPTNGHKRKETREGRSSHMMEYCPNCLELFPVAELVAHSTDCPAIPLASASHTEVSLPLAGPHPLELEDDDHGDCPTCSRTFPIGELVEHCQECRAMPSSPKSATPPSSPEKDMMDPASHSTSRCADNDRPERGGAVSGVGAAEETTPGDGVGGAPADGKVPADSMLELELCEHCLQEFPLCELLVHHDMCKMKRKRPSVKEQCPHCLRDFSLDEIISHSSNCSQKKDEPSLEVDSQGVIGGEEVWGEPVERCMHCFKDFPLSKMVRHSNKCKEELLGNKDRFKDFLPSVHDVDAMTITVLTEAQREAVEYVTRKSRKDSVAVYSNLKEKVISLGFTETDLKRTLQWVHREAPIIIHLKLDRMLHLLVKDTHYRNLFETSAGSGCLSKDSRRNWEDNIFNGVYSKHRVSAFERVKYGVLNIVGDPRGVRCCYSYGDSFLQLKKVRLRTTFASMDTSSSAVILSCCEHYGNVLNRYSNAELKSIIEVSTGRKLFAKSDIISTYKEVQIHGPVCLSENVECLVVNNRHQSDPIIGKLLQEFAERNSCNIIWMEPEERIDYPT